RRRLWLALTLFGVVFTLTVSLIVFLPNIYTASALILVEGQQIPEEFVRSTVRIPVQNRLYTISQEVLSRSRLERLITDFNLYEDLRQRRRLDEVLAVVRRAISIDIKEGARDGAVAFAISFSGTDPQKVTRIANTLASFYIEENLKIRERQAIGTADFLQVELQQTKKKLEEQEQQVKQYKERCLGELPEQLDANLKTLERLQAQSQLLAENLARTQERRNTLAQQVAQADASVIGSVTGPAAVATQLQTLRRQLAELQTRFSDKYPDVAQTRREIAALEEQSKNRPEGTFPEDRNPTRPARAPAYLTPLQIQLNGLDTDLRLLTAERAKVQRDIAAYQQRVENTPKREQELLLLTRDYNSTRELYASLLKRQEEANLAGSMERHQKGEQFRILDPASPPEQPVGPQRFRLFVVGLLLSLGAAAGAVVLWEKVLDTSFHRVEDLEAYTKAAVLVTIPRIVTGDDRARRRRRQYLGAAAVAVTLLVLAGAVQRIAWNNEQLVMQFAKLASGLH
ncbi:MAG: hypothetical protein HYZ72_10265, partial [Deltaproteobacteria bacterium]|nr:hypothetical protein [Deltaproteobacteria bacterium]